MLLNNNLKTFFSVRQLIKHCIHLGVQSTLLHASSLKYILPYSFLNFTLLNLRYTLWNLQLGINLALDLLVKRGFFLIINSTNRLDMFLLDFFRDVDQPVSRNLWVPGRLTNFWKVRRQSVKAYFLHRSIIRKYIQMESIGCVNMRIRNIMSRVFNPTRYIRSVGRYVINLLSMPKICFISDATINSVAVRETSILNLPAITIVDSGSDAGGVSYAVPGNSSSLVSLLFYYSLVKTVMKVSQYKERYLFILTALRQKLRQPAKALAEKKTLNNVSGSSTKSLQSSLFRFSVLNKFGKFYFFNYMKSLLFFKRYYSFNALLFSSKFLFDDVFFIGGLLNRYELSVNSFAYSNNFDLTLLSKYLRIPSKLGSGVDDVTKLKHLLLNKTLDNLGFSYAGVNFNSVMLNLSFYRSFWYSFNLTVSAHSFGNVSYKSLLLLYLFSSSRVSSYDSFKLSSVLTRCNKLLGNCEYKMSSESFRYIFFKYYFCRNLQAFISISKDSSYYRSVLFKVKPNKPSNLLFKFSSSKIHNLMSTGCTLNFVFNTWPASGSVLF